MIDRRLIYPRPSKLETVRKVYQSRINSEHGDDQLAKLHYNWLNSSAFIYEKSFARELRHGELANYLHKRFHAKKINCLDIGGVGEQLFDNLRVRRVNIGHTVGLSLHQLSDLRSEDGWNHEGVVGDAYSNVTIEKIKTKFRHVAGLDFIISRMGAGLDYRPSNPIVLFQTLNSYYKMLNEGGTMLLQLPVRDAKLMRIWFNFIKRQNISGLNIKVKFPSDAVPSDASSDPRKTLTMILEKNHGAPTELPYLPLMKVFRIKE